MLEVSVEFVSEIISCIKDKDNKIVSGDAHKKLKKCSIHGNLLKMVLQKILIG